MKLIRFFLLLFFIIFIGTFVDQNKPKKAEYIKVSYNDFPDNLSHGILKSSFSTNLGFQTEGQIIFLPYTKGDFIKKGTVIAKLDGSFYSIKRKEEYSKLQEFFVQKQKQNSYFKRLDLLHKVGAISDNDWENAFYELKTINSQIITQKEKINYLDKEISQNIILAPYDAYIKEKFLDVGAYAKIGTPVISIIGTNSMQAEVMVSDNLISKLQTGQETQIIISNKKYKGIIEHISKSSFEAGGYLIKITLLNPDSNLKDGMSADVDFLFKKDNILTLPVESIFEENGEKYVYKIKNIKNSIGYIQKVKIKIGNLKQENIEVIEGLNNGDIIVSKNIYSHYQNQKVKI